jgi:hypothetical protein
MNLYVVRRPSGSTTPDELQAAAMRSRPDRGGQLGVADVLAALPVTEIFAVTDIVVVPPGPVDTRA